MKHALLFSGLLLLAGSMAQPLAAQSLDAGFAPSAIFGSGTAYSAVEQPDGKRLVVGAFTRVNGTPAGYLTRLSPTGALDAGFQQNLGTTAAIYRAGLLGNGQILLTGFTNTPLLAGGLYRNGLLRLNADGTGDASFDPGTGPVSGGQAGGVDQALPLPNGQLLAVGYFDHFNSSVANGIVRLNASGSVDATLNAGTGADDEVLTIVALPGGKFLIGGLFATYNGVACNGIARLNADGSLDPTFTPAIGQYSNVINLTVQPDGRVLVGGYLEGPAGTTGLTRLLPNGSADGSFTPPAALAEVYSSYSYYGNAVELQPDGKIVLLNTAGGAGSITRLNANGTVDNSFQVGTGTNAAPLSITRLASGSVLAAGSFTDFNGTLDRPLVQLTSTGTTDPSFQPLLQLPGSINKLVRQADGKLLVGGSFTEINGQTVRRLARFNPNGTPDNTFLPAANLAFAPQGLELQPDGRFLLATSTEVRRYLSSGSADNSFTPYSAPVAGITQLLLQPDGRVLVGNNNGGTTSGGLVRLQANGLPDASFTAALNTGRLANVQGLALQANGKVLVSGSYTPGTGPSYRTVVRLESTGAQDASFALTPITTVFTNRAPTEVVVQPDGKVLVGGGQFTAVGGAARVGLARLNADGTLDAGFVPPLFPNSVFKVVLQPNNRILVGGAFVGGILPNYLARLLPTGAPDASYGATAQPNASVRTLLVQPDGTLMVGGSFTTVGGVTAPALARLTASNVLHVAAPAAVAARTEAWPVPAHTTLTVLPDAAAHPQLVELLDALGWPVQRRVLTGPAGAELSVAGLPAGTYLLRVSYAEGAVVRRVQVQ